MSASTVNEAEGPASLSPLARLYGEYDWESSPLGPRAAWPSQLKMLIEFLLESSQPMFLLWGPRQVLLFNDAFRPILGENYVAALARPSRELWSEIWSDIGPYIDEAYAGRSRLAEDVPLRTWSSDYAETRYYTFSYSPIRNVTGTVVAAVCIANDTTAKVLTQQQIRDERDKLHLLFEQAPVFLAVGSAPDMRFEYANKAYRELVGVDDLAGRTVSEALPDTESQGFADLLLSVTKTGQPFFGHDIPYERKGADGVSRRTLDFVYQPIFSDGKVTGILCVGSDVTERHEARDRAQKLQDQLQHGARLSAMGAMAATLAHELNQPLTAAANFLRGGKRLAGKSGQRDEGLDFALTQTERQIVRAGEIIKRVRDLVAGNAQHGVTSVQELVDSAIQQAQPSTWCKGIKTTWKLERSDEPVFVDILQTEQVLINLIRNASSAMRDRDRKQLEIRSRKMDHLVEIEVQDSGPGLSQELLEVLFSPFVESQGGGMGIGLAICRTIVESQGGRISAFNNPEGGATFRFTVPAATAENNAF